MREDRNIFSEFSIKNVSNSKNYEDSLPHTGSNYFPEGSPKAEDGSNQVMSINGIMINTEGSMGKFFRLTFQMK